MHTNIIQVDNPSYTMTTKTTAKSTTATTTRIQKILSLSTFMSSSFYYYYYLVVVGFLVVGFVSAWEQCPPEAGGGVCPDHDFCCPSRNQRTALTSTTTTSLSSSSCIPGIRNKTTILYPGVCCGSSNNDDIDDACGENYTCAVVQTVDDFGNEKKEKVCQVIPDTVTNDVTIPPILPRYRLCSLPHAETTLKQVYGLVITTTATTTTTNHYKNNRTQLSSNTSTIDNSSNNNSHNQTSSFFAAAYYSSLGSLTYPIDPEMLKQQADTHTLIITIHGSDRNADDYLCGTFAALSLHNHDVDPNHTMVIAPWFLAPQDVVEFLDPSIVALQWQEKNPRLPHTWRWGADSIQGNVSSFAVLDAFLDYIVAQITIKDNDDGSNNNDQKSRRGGRFPNLKRIIITGHSAGGQFTHRWVLLSNHPLLSSSQLSSLGISLRVVAANPKSFCYLDGRRLVTNRKGQAAWKIPSSTELYHCSFYNDWTWGLGNSDSSDGENYNDNHDQQQEKQPHGGDWLPTPYKDRAIVAAGGIQYLIQRYASRPVVYLSGYLDVVPNGDCPDLFQGINRRERSRRYFRYLQHVIYPNDTTTTTTTTTIPTTRGLLKHHRIEAMHVHHDHSLLYQSPEGQVALFGNISTLTALQEQQEKMWKVTAAAAVVVAAAAVEKEETKIVQDMMLLPKHFNDLSEEQDGNNNVDKEEEMRPFLRRFGGSNSD